VDYLSVPQGRVWVSTSSNSDHIQTLTFTSSRPGRAELLYDLGPKARDTTAIYTDITKDGRFLYLSLTTANHIAALDISDLNNVKRLDDPDEEQPTLGPHFIKIAPDQKHFTVTDYFVQTGDIGILNTPGDYKALWVDIADNGAPIFNRTIDFAREFYNRGGAKPHSSVVFDLTDPKNPKYL
jgi:selenium-binding protein 1